MKSNFALWVRLVLTLVSPFALPWISAQSVSAVPIPPPGAHANATAAAAGGPNSNDADDGQATASASATSNGDDFAQGAAQATVGGAARSRSSSAGASGKSDPSSATGTARWISNLVATGTDPGNPIDLDLFATVDGALDYLNNNSGASFDDIRASVHFTLSLHDQSGATRVFDGSAKLATVASNDPPQLARTGDWANPAHDGDFSTSSCSGFSCRYEVQLNTAFDDVAFIGFGETFAVEFELATSAYTFAGREVEALSDFFNTGSLAVTTDTAGVTFQLVPEPDSFLIFVTAIGVLALSVRTKKALC